MTEARVHIASLLAGLPVPVHPEPPEVPSGTCVIVGPAPETWAGIEPVAGRMAVGIAVSVLVPTSGGRGMLARLEDLLWQVIQTPGIQPTPGLPVLSPLERVQYGAAEFYTASIVQTVHVLCE